MIEDQHIPMLPTPHPIIVRLCHWAFALAILVLVTSGWQIYNASPLFGFRFPAALALGGWLGGGIAWHLAAIWVLGASFGVYAVYGFVSGRFGRRLWPINFKQVVGEVDDALNLRLEHGDLEVYNHTQRLAYVVVIGAMALAIMSGLVLWKPVQFPVLRTLMGDYEVARRVHFFAMVVIVGFVAVHVALVVAVPRTLNAIVGIFKMKDERHGL